MNKVQIVVLDQRNYDMQSRIKRKYDLRMTIILFFRILNGIIQR